MRLIERMITTYEIGNGYYVNVDTDLQKTEYGVWLYHINYGIKMYMFGELFENIPDIQELEGMIEANVENYIRMYNERFGVV